MSHTNWEGIDFWQCPECGQRFTGAKRCDNCHTPDAERAAVVRFLRALGVNMDCTHEERLMASDCADAIERGEHLKDKP